MKKLFLTLALVVCWAVTAFAAGQINGLTLAFLGEQEKAALIQRVAKG